MSSPSMSNPHADDAETPERREQLNLERALRAQMATVTGGLAPDVYVNAWWDWLLNLAKEPPQQLKLAEAAIGGKPQGSEKFVIARDIAAPPGKVVLRNDVIDLIQYAPATETVFAEPILIIPAWIMKYYILDLSANNSLVSYLVSQGHTVFMVSWKNPTESDRNLGMDDYLRLGIRAAFDAVSRIVPERKIHSVGYCIGGTLLSIAEAVFAAEGDLRAATMTLLAAQQDFSEPGELSLFISPSQIDMLEAVMNRTGVLKSAQMA